jgi:hypothetical protein
MFVVTFHSSPFQMEDTKSADRKTTLLHYFVHLIDARFSEAATWWSEVPAVESARKCKFLSLPYFLRYLY